MHCTILIVVVRIGLSLLHLAKYEWQISIAIVYRNLFYIQSIYCFDGLGGRKLLFWESSSVNECIIFWNGLRTIAFSLDKTLGCFSPLDSLLVYGQVAGETVNSTAENLLLLVGEMLSQLHQRGGVCPDEHQICTRLRKSGETLLLDSEKAFVKVEVAGIQRMNFD